jgi:hypothetical protein
MSVIGPSCSPGSETSASCACAPKTTTGAGLAAQPASRRWRLPPAQDAASCPLTPPAAILAVAGSSLALLDHAHVWVSRLAIAIVAGVWLWIGWQAWRGGRRVARTTLVIMVLASLLAGAAASWPLIEQPVFSGRGLVKKNVSRGG